MAWMFVLAAGLLEIVWAYSMKLSQGFTRPVPTTITIFMMLGSLALRSLSMKPFRSARPARRTGIGAVGAFVVGMRIPGEPLTAGRVLAATMILAGVTIMKLTTSA